MAFPRMASPLTPYSTWASQVAGEDILDDEYNAPTPGEFAVHMPPMVPPYEKNLDDELVHDGTPDESQDPADIADADAFEELGQNGHSFVMPTLDQSAIDGSPDIPNALDQLPNGVEAGSTEAMPTVVIDHFPSASAGAPIDDMPRGSSIYEAQRGADGDSTWSPFISECDWLFARWAKMRGSTSSAVAELLAIPEVRAFSLRLIFTCTNSIIKIVDKLGLSYGSVQELNHVIDTQLPGRPRFQCSALDIGDEELEFHWRDVLGCI
jgi:hypothetical protein